MGLTYQTCPKCGHERTPEEATASEDACPACGLIFAKYLQTRVSRSPSRAALEEADDESLKFKELLFHIPERVDPLHVYLRATLLAALVIYGVKLAAMD